MKQSRALRWALELLGRGGLEVDAMVEGARHSVIKIVGGGRLIISRGAGAGEHGRFLIERDVRRLVRATTRAAERTR
jgi:hypothetical protein